MIYLEVLHLKLHVSLLLSVNEFRKHSLAIARLEVLLALRDTLVRYTLLQLPVGARIVIKRVRYEHLIIERGHCLLLFVLSQLD